MIRWLLPPLLFLSYTFLFAQQKVTVLGIAQDGGFPHIGCQKECLQAHQNPELARFVTSLALIDPETHSWWLFEASPDMSKQLQLFQELTNGAYNYLPNGIFITHAHIGHYTGLMYLGRESFGAKEVPVFVLPKLKHFLEQNGPWSQLVKLKNIQIKELEAGSPTQLPGNMSVVPFTVPHRDEFSETAGFRILTENKKYLFIPDIDKWSKWNESIVEKVKAVDYAFLDATFFEDGELPNRSIDEVPHPFVSETISLFRDQPIATKNKIQFIHLNHTNPLLFNEEKRQEVLKKGFGIAIQGKGY